MPGEDYYLAADVRELDRIAIQEKGIPGFTLMHRAGTAAFNALLAKWPATENIMCFCGSGNNGGDGYIIASLAAKQGLKASVIAVGSPEKLRGDALTAYHSALEAGVSIEPFATLNSAFHERPTRNTVLVDAMLGTGLSGNVTGSTLAAIEVINASPCPVVAADIPSGLCSDTGRILGSSVKADLTVTFIGRKVGQVIESGPGLCGELLFDDLDVPGEIYEKVSPVTSKYRNDLKPF